MRHQVEKEDESVLTDYVLVSYYPEEEAFLPRLEDGRFFSYECEDKFLQDYTNFYDIWEKDGERFIKDDFVDDYIKTGKIPVLNDGRPEMEQFFNYTISSNIFWVGWYGNRILAKTFMENMLKIYKEHGNVPEYLSSISQKIIELAEWNPPVD